MIVLDTHVLIWYLDSPQLLSKKAAAAVNEARKSAAVYVSSISAWEIFMLEKKGRLRFRIGADLWIAKCERLSFLTFVPVDNEIARLATDSSAPKVTDPADRIIAATARYLGAPLVTKDRTLRNSSHVKTVW